MRTPDGVEVRAVRADDAAAVARIYNHYVTDTIVTFEEDPVPADEIAARIRAVQTASLPWVVAEQGGEIVGYAYAGIWKPRRGYRIAVETTVYLDAGSGGRGIGSALIKRALKDATEQGHKLVVLVGDEPYYAKSGFKRIPKGQVKMPGPVDPARLLVAELVPGAAEGVSGLIRPDWET